MSALKKLAGETVIYGIPSIVGRFLNYFLTPLYTWMFLPGEFGILSNVLAYVAFMQVFLTYGMETSYFRYAGKEENHSRVLTTSNISLIATTTIFMIVLVLFSAPLANWMSYPNHKNYIIWMGLTVAFDTICTIPFARLRWESKPIRFAVLKLSNIGMSIVLNLFWIYLCPKVLAKHPHSFLQYFYDPSIGIGYVFLSYLIPAIFTTLFFLGDFKIKIKDFDFGLLKRMLNYGWPILIIGVAGMVNLNLDKILLPKLIHHEPIRELGIYAANSKLAILMTLFIQAFRFSFEPFLFAHYKNEDSKKTYAVIMKYFVILGLLIFLGVLFYMDLIKYFIGSRKMGYHEGIKVVPWLLMGNLMLGIFYTQSLWYKLTDQTHFGARFALVGAAITIVMNLILIPFLGYMGCGYTFFTATVVMTVMSYVTGQKYFPVRYDLRRITCYFTVAILLYLIESHLNIGSLIIKLTVNTLLLSIFFLLIYALDKRDMRKLFSSTR